MFIKKWIALALFMTASCGSEDEILKNKDEPIPGSYYWPSFANASYWGKVTKGWMVSPLGKRVFTDEEKAVADDLTRYHEKVWETGSKTLNHGYIPKVFLSNPKITYEDMTSKSIPGMEKLYPVIERISKRCGVFSPDRKEGLSVKVFWHTENTANDAFVKHAYGAFSSGSMTAMRIKDYQVKPYQIGAHISELWMPESHIDIIGGFHEGDSTTYGFFKKDAKWKQTYEDYLGAPPGEIPKVKDPSGEYAGYRLGQSTEWPTLDIVFAHELGHAFFQEWALMHGRSTFVTRKFQEMIAETFELLCYNDVPPGEIREIEYWKIPLYVGKKAKSGNPYKEPFNKSDCTDSVNCESLSTFARQAGRGPKISDPPFSEIEMISEPMSPYTYILPFTQRLQSDLMARGLWSDAERKKIFNAILATLENMQGVRLPMCSPAETITALSWPHPKDSLEILATEPRRQGGRCPWGIVESELVVPMEQRSLAFTAREFFELFPKYYELPKYLQEGYQSSSDFLNTVWEY